MNARIWPSWRQEHRLLHHAAMVMGIIALASIALLCVTATIALLALVRQLFRIGPRRARLHWRPVLAPSPRGPSAWSSRDVDEALAILAVEDDLAASVDALDEGSVVMFDDLAPRAMDSESLDATVEAAAADFSEPTVAEDVYSSAEEIAAMLAREAPARRAPRGSVAPVPRGNTILGVVPERRANAPRLARAMSAITPS